MSWIMWSSTLDYGLWRLQAVKTNDLIPVFILNFFGQIYLYILEALLETQQSGNTEIPFFSLSFSNVYDILTLSQTIFSSSRSLSLFSIASNLHFLLTGTALRVLMENLLVIITWTHLGMRLATSLVFPLNIFMISMHRRNRMRMNVFGTAQINPHKCSTTALETHSAEM